MRRRHQRGRAPQRRLKGAKLLPPRLQRGVQRRVLLQAPPHLALLYAGALLVLLLLLLLLRPLLLLLLLPQREQLLADQLRGGEARADLGQPAARRGERLFADVSLCCVVGRDVSTGLQAHG